MRDENAQELLASVMAWDESRVIEYVPRLQLLADHKYDQYQRYFPGKRFVESLALWLQQFEPDDRPAAMDFVVHRLVYISDAEFSHLVLTAYPDLIVQERIRMIAEEKRIPSYRVGAITSDPRFPELRLKSLYLGLSDGARTNELRRSSNGEISNEQIWQAYELGAEKADDMRKELRTALEKMGASAADPRFSQVWLLDDFSGSGNTYIRYDAKARAYKGKLRKIYEQLHRAHLIDPEHYDIFLLLYVATRQAIDHIEYWTDRFTSEHGYKPLQVRVLCPLEREISLGALPETDPLSALLRSETYRDPAAADEHFRVGGTTDERLGFAGCALPVALCHNAPNNSLYIVWGPDGSRFFGLFPRVSRHREF